MQVCKQMIDGIDVKGSLSRRTGTRPVYHITMWPMPKCTCVAFAIARNRAVSVRPDVEERYPEAIAFCKHLDMVYDSTCHYTEAKDGEPLFDGRCPHCSGPTVNVLVATECKTCHTDLPDENITFGVCDECLVAQV